MGTRAHLFSSLAALAAAVIAGAAGWVVGPPLLVPGPAGAPAAPLAFQPDPDWAHQRGPVCNPASLHQSAGFPVGPVSSSIPASLLRSIPAYPGAPIGPVTERDETRQWLVGGWKPDRANSSDLVHNGYACDGAAASADFLSLSDPDIVASWYGRTLQGVGFHTAITWGKDWDPRGRGTRVFRRGAREWLEISFSYQSDGRVGAQPDRFFHGRLTYTIAPSPCDGLSQCGLYVFSGSLGT